MPTMQRRRRCMRHMPCAPESARSARHLVQEKLTDWGRLDLLEDARLIVSELVGNAARHTGCTWLCAALGLDGDRLRLAVRDSSRALPVVVKTGVTETSGRGMGLVDRIANRWGVDEAPFGKWVWAEIGCPPKTLSQAGAQGVTATEYRSAKEGNTCTT
ncbi:ATP-binding protein [Kitasatospora sp. NPDC005748]|uniref:ATP-binding protein n=1 Tax=Kitasatospora sp. NPDC005748 TaxID=3157063 RepID=UPI0033F20D1D